MMERMPHSPEQIDSLSAEKLEQLKPGQTEKSPERHKPQHEQLEQAREQLKHTEVASQQTERAPIATPNPWERLREYRHTLSSLQHRLKPSERRFSRFIHAPLVEKVSETLETTVARPSITLGATVTAALIGGFFYLTARRSGFRLSGSEFIISLLVGGLVGYGLELVSRSLRKRRAK
jgi:hypothetical protein